MLAALPRLAALTSMHRLLPRAGLLVAGLLALPGSAQETVAPRAATLGTEPLDGVLPGTKRFNVVFHDRKFTLDEFRAAVAAGRPAEEVERIVARLQAMAEAERAGFRARIEELGGRVHLTFWLIDACAIEIDPAKVEQVRALPGVARVDPDLPTAPAILVATNADNHNTDAVHASGNRGTGFGVAVIDTGQDSDMGTSRRPHRTYFRGGNPAITDAGGLGGSLLLANVAMPGTVGADNSHQHGTGVMGIAAGSVWGAANADDGHACDAYKVGYSICEQSGSCSSSFATQAAAWQQAAADKVRYNIVAANMSYTSHSSLLDVSQQAIDAAALHADILPVCAAGNSGASGTANSAAVANGLAVAAAHANTRAVANFSSRGPMGLRTYPDILANGVDVAMPKRDDENGVYLASGTSMAAPQVCGTGVLVRHARPNASAREVKAILLASSENVAGNVNAVGQGYLRSDYAVDCAASRNSVLTASIASTSTPNDHLLTVVAGQEVKIALTWFRHDVQSASYSDLGLTVLNGTTTIASKDSPANLYEVVTFVAPTTGSLTVRVHATNLTVNPQPYSLAACVPGGPQPEFAGGPTGIVRIDGHGCAGSGGIPSLHPSGNPAISGSFTLGVTYVRPSTTAFLFLGASNTNWAGLALPLDLGPFGAPTCFLRAAGDAVVPVAIDAAGTGSVTLSIPNGAWLVNADLFAQVLPLDPGSNALDLVASNSLRVTIGAR